MAVYYFGYRRQGPPSDHRAVVDCRAVQQPHRRGQPDEVARALVREHELFEPLVQLALSFYEDYGVVAVGCSWGRHRSYAVAHEVARRLGVDALPLP